MKGLARHPVPVMILARLAVDRDQQGKGLGKALLKDALLRTAQAADISGIRCLLVHAKDETERQRYESWEFEPSPTDTYDEVHDLRHGYASFLVNAGRSLYEVQSSWGTTIRRCRCATRTCRHRSRALAFRSRLRGLCARAG